MEAYPHPCIPPTPPTPVGYALPHVSVVLPVVALALNLCAVLTGWLLPLDTGQLFGAFYDAQATLLGCTCALVVGSSALIIGLRRRHPRRYLFLALAAIAAALFIMLNLAILPVGPITGGGSYYRL